MREGEDELKTIKGRGERDSFKWLTNAKTQNDNAKEKLKSHSVRER